MRTVSISCPDCQAVYTVKVESVGKRARCTKCNASFVISPAVPARHDSEDEDLTVCTFCGFQDSGNFCSNCGGRISGSPSFDFDGCRVSLGFFKDFPENLVFDLNMDSVRSQRLQHLYEMRQKCENFNRQIDDLARTVRFEGPDAASWRYRRVEISRLLDDLPEEVPDRQAIATALWTVVSDLERAAKQDQVADAVKDVEDAIALGDLKKIERAIRDSREVLKESPNQAAELKIKALEDNFNAIRESRESDRQVIAFTKLLDKADKLAFQSEWKKAIKAYQECLFWLSRNELPDKLQYQSSVQEKLAHAEAEVAQK